MKKWVRRTAIGAVFAIAGAASMLQPASGAGVVSATDTVTWGGCKFIPLSNTAWTSVTATNATCSQVQAVLQRISGSGTVSTWRGSWVGPGGSSGIVSTNGYAYKRGTAVATTNNIRWF